jgi:hypothetical protein
VAEELEHREIVLRILELWGTVETEGLLLFTAIRDTIIPEGALEEPAELVTETQLEVRAAEEAIALVMLKLVVQQHIMAAVALGGRRTRLMAGTLEGPDTKDSLWLGIGLDNGSK